MIYRKLIANGLILGMFFTNISTSFANYINLKENKYTQELSDIKTKEDLQKSAQKAVKDGKVNTWIEGLSNMPTSRGNLASSVIDGKIYVIGGFDDSPRSNKVEVYDTETDSWETKTPMPTSRDNLTSAVVDGKIYVIGGTAGKEHNIYSYLNTVEVYDPETNSWETKAPMPTKRGNLTSAVVDGKIYCIGGVGISFMENTVEVYDPETNSWETKAPMPTKRGNLTSAVVDGKIYCIGGGFDTMGYLNKVEVYDPVTDTWETKTPMPTSRSGLIGVLVDDKIYCIGGRYYSYLNTVEVYNTVTDTWETKAPMPTARYGLIGEVVGGKIYCIGGHDGSSYLNIVEAYITKTSPEDEAKDIVNEAEKTREPEDIKNARNLINQLEEGALKKQLQGRLDAIIPNLTLDRKNTTANVDVYIKSENMLSMSLSTNSITFEDYSGVEEIEKSNALTVNINSSLAYDLNAYLVSEIQNADGSNKIDIDRLNIKANDETAYQEFAGINQKLTLKSNCNSGNDLAHNIDLKLNGDDAYPADIYKTVIKFEAEQK